MNFKQKIEKFVYGFSPLINISLSDWLEHTEQIISEIGSDNLNIWIGDYGAANICKLDSSIYIKIYLEKAIPSMWFYKDWMFFWQTFVANGYKFRQNTHLLYHIPFSTDIMGPDECLLKFKEFGSNSPFAKNLTWATFEAKYIGTI